MKDLRELVVILEDACQRAMQPTNRLNADVGQRLRVLARTAAGPQAPLAMYSHRLIDEGYLFLDEFQGVVAPKIDRQPLDDDTLEALRLVSADNGVLAATVAILDALTFAHPMGGNIAAPEVVEASRYLGEARGVLVRWHQQAEVRRLLRHSPPPMTGWMRPVSRHAGLEQ